MKKLIGIVLAIVLLAGGVVGSVSANPGDIEAGIPALADLNAWQSWDDPTNAGGGRWYCNAALAVNGAGTLTNWDIYVDNGGVNGEKAQLAVIRPIFGGGGGGPALSGCYLVGIGPPLTITGDGLNTFSLAGSLQLDGASPDANGIVVQAGDYICADGNDYDIGVDFNGSPVPGGAPGPDLNTQYLTNLDIAPQPFTLLDSDADGTLMIRAWGYTPSEPPPEPPPDPTPIVHQPLTGMKLVGIGRLGFEQQATCTIEHGSRFVFTNPDCVGNIKIRRIAIFAGDGTVIYEGPLLRQIRAGGEVVNDDPWPNPMAPHQTRHIILWTYFPDPGDPDHAWMSKQEALSQGAKGYTVEIFYATHKKGLPLIGHVGTRRTTVYGDGMTTEAGFRNEMWKVKQKLSP